MAQRAEVLVEKLCDENKRFYMLNREHSLLEKELQQFGKRTYLTAEEEMERKRLQKLKLAGKDEMERIMTAYGA